MSGDGDIAAALERQNRVLDALSTGPVLRTDRPEQAFHLLTEAGADTLGVARVSIWRLQPGPSRIECVDLFDQARRTHDSGQQLMEADHPDYFAAIRGARSVAIEDALGDPRTGTFAQAYLQPLGVGAMLDAAITVAGETVGVVCHEHVGGPRRWQPHEVAFASSIADFAARVLGGAQRREAERALSEQSALLRRALAAARMGTWYWDIVGDVIRWSDETARLFGYEPGYHPPSFDAYGQLLHPADIDAVKLAVSRALEDPNANYHVEHRVLQPGGHVRWFEGRGTVVRSHSGEPLALTGTVTDITERRELEIELRQAQKMDAIGHLAGGVAHDFNNLLTVISGQTELARLSLGDAGREELDEIAEAATRAAGLTRQLLAFARKQAIRPTVLDVRALVGDLTRMLRRLIGEHIELALHLPDAPCTVRADAAQLEQVIINLVVNARDAMGPGGQLSVTVSLREVGAQEARAVRDIHAGTHVVLSVQDTGEGIPADVVDRIFDPFFTTKEVGQGTGLGLSTCYGIVRQAGGAIRVESEPGQGTRFDVLLPQVDAPARSIMPPAPHGSDAERTATILVVEDAPMVRKLTTRFLETAGYALMVAADGAEALKLAERASRPIDLILLDVVLPGIRGEQLVERVRQFHPRAGVLFVSGYAEGTIAEQGVLMDGVRLLPKPFKRAELLEQVERSLAERDDTRAPLVH